MSLTSQSTATQIPTIVDATAAKLYVSKFYDLIASRVKQPIVLLSGGRGGAKSTSVAQAFGRSAVRGQYRRQAIVRKYFKYIRDSQYTDIKTYLERLRIESEVNIGVSPLGFRFPNGSEIISLGLDKSKVKSLSNVERVWVEEATELSREDWLNLVPTILRGSGHKQIILTYNPEYGHWLNDEFFHPNGQPKRDDTYYLHSIYKDNPFVGPVFTQWVEGLSTDLYERIGLGKPKRLEGLIYPNYEVVDSFPDAPFVYGVDKGFNDPFAVLRACIQGDYLYWDEVLYERFRTTSQIIPLLSKEQKHKPWYFDDSAADTIAEFANAGFNATKANKGLIYDGIQKVKKYKLRVTRQSVNLLKELSTYTWLTDRNNVTHDEPTPGLPDHLLDAGRYATINLARPQGRARAHAHAYREE